MSNFGFDPDEFSDLSQRQWVRRHLRHGSGSGMLIRRNSILCLGVISRENVHRQRVVGHYTKFEPDLCGDGFTQYRVFEYIVRQKNKGVVRTHNDGGVKEFAAIVKSQA